MGTICDIKRIKGNINSNNGSFGRQYNEYDNNLIKNSYINLNNNQIIESVPKAYVIKENVSKVNVPKENVPQENDNSKINNYIINFSQLIGKGAFGKIYIGKDLQSQNFVAIKIEANNNNYSYLLNENKIYKILKGYQHIPIIYDCFQHDDNNYLVMERLGKSLDSIFREYHKRFSLSTVLNIGINILDILEYIHSKNIIHRDLKPDCFLIGKEKKSKIYIIDFGFAMNYIDPNLGLPYPLSKDAFVGNYKFTSNNSILNGYNKSRRDDIESLAYIIIYFIKGLPWELSKSKNDIQIIRRQTTIDSLCLGVPLEIKEFLLYSWNIKFFGKPNYLYLRNLLEKCAKNNRIVLSKNNYDWIIAEQNDAMENKSFVTLNNKEFGDLSCNSNILVQEEDKMLISNNYIQTKNAFKINNILRTEGYEGLSEENYKTFFALNKAIQNYKTKEDYMAYRYVDNNYLKDTFNFIPNNNINFNLQKIKEQIGSVKVVRGFMSCFMTDRHVIEREILLEIKIPKGTNAYITQNTQESEIILKCNTEYQIMDAKIVKNIILINICILGNQNSIILHNFSN